MPYQERLKSGVERKREKPTYRVTNWTKYNRSLKQRGMLSLYFPKGNIAEHFICRHTYVEGVSGRCAQYRPAYIQFAFTLYRLFGWGMRQITGYLEDHGKSNHLGLPVPIFGHLSELLASLGVTIIKRCEKIAERVKAGESIALIVDSTGMRFSNAGDWYEKKYGQSPDRRPWRKMHVAMDVNGDMYAIKVTDAAIGDSPVLDDLLSETQDLPVGKILGDGAYYNTERNEDLLSRCASHQSYLHQHTQ